MVGETGQHWAMTTMAATKVWMWAEMWAAHLGTALAIVKALTKGEWLEMPMVWRRGEVMVARMGDKKGVLSATSMDEWMVLMLVGPMK